MATEILTIKNKVGTFKITDSNKILARCIDGDYIIDDLKISINLFEHIDSLNNAHKTLKELLNSLIVQFDIYEVYPNESNKRTRHQKNKITYKANITAYVNTNERVFWNQLIPTLRDYVEQNPKTLVTRSQIVTSPSVVNLRYIDYNAPVSPLDAYLFWVTEAKEALKGLELKLTNGTYLAGKMGTIEEFKHKPTLEFEDDNYVLSRHKNLSTEEYIEYSDEVLDYEIEERKNDYQDDIYEYNTLGSKIYYFLFSDIFIK